MKIGLLGGTFDPPHFGHLIMAEEALMQCALDEIWFLPSYLPPHAERKTSAHPLSAEHRLEMVQLAISGNARFQLSLIEYERKGKSYTYKTIHELREKYPEHQFYFIIGADMVNDLPKWVRFDEIKRQVTFIGFNRAGVVWHAPEGVHIIKAVMPEIGISSSIVRKKIGEQGAWHYLVPDQVKKYIEVNGLYE
ncbi:MAG: nicotinate-nucleotide adenylyltransferase [Tuberibacillus sp.]